MVTRRHPLSRRFPSSLVSPVVAGTFPLARRIARTFSLKTKKRISKFYLQFAVYSRTLGQLPCKAKASVEKVLELRRGVGSHGVKLNQLMLGSALPVEPDMFILAGLRAD